MIIPAVAAAHPAYHYDIEIQRVIDGDTLAVVVDLGFNVYHRTHLRLHGINCPEMSGPGGREARDAVVARWAGGGRATASIKGPDKYGGRWLAVVYFNGESLNDWLVSNGHAVPYLTARGAYDAPVPDEERS